MNDFYDKENNPEYYKKYEAEHAARLDWIIEHFSMKSWVDNSVLDIGCGSGYLLNRLNPEKNYLCGLDSSTVCENLKRTFKFIRCCLDDGFFSKAGNGYTKITCFETLEHLSNLYICVEQMKWCAVENADIYLSIPHESVTHNTLYPALFYPETNFEQFLSQMALPIVEKIHCTQSFPTWIYHCKNRPWSEKQLKWPKSDERFKDMDVLGVINN